jgi:hypothetical protein
MTINIDFALVCDEVRREDNGKILIIGIYPYDIIVMNFPVDFALTVAVSVNIDAPVKTNFELKLSHDGKLIGTGKGHFRLEKSSIIWFPKMPLQNISGPGELQFEVRFGDDEWKPLRKLPILSANVLPQPS